MAKHAPAPEPPGDVMNEGDYAALLATLSASERGRAFLAEFARRQRAAETDRVMGALERLDAKIARIDEQIAAQQAPPAAEPPQPEPAAADQPAVADMPTFVEATPVRLSVVTQPARDERPAVQSSTLVSVSTSPPALKQPTAAVIPEVVWQAADALPVDDRIRITIADDDPGMAIIDDQLVTAAAKAPLENTAVEEAPAFAVAAILPEVPQPRDVAVSMEIAAEAEVTVALSRDEPTPLMMLSDTLEPPAPAAMPSDILEQPTTPTGDELDVPASVSVVIEQVTSSAEVAVEQTAPSSIEPPDEAALPRTLIDQPPPSADHPLAHLMALTDEERIALFS